MAYAIQVNIADQWECGDWITPETNNITGERIPAMHDTRAAAESALAELLADMAGQGMECDSDCWRVVAVATPGELMESACCLWEAMLERGKEGCGELWKEGAAAARSWACSNAAQLHSDWLAAVEGGYDQPFDWEFTPEWLAEKIGDDAAAECARNGHRDTGRGVCADCGEFI